MNPKTSIQIFDLENRPDLKIIMLAGQFDEFSLELISSEIDHVVATSRIKHLFLDLKNLEFINSKAIGYLASLHWKLQDKKSHLILLSPPQNILETLDLVGILNLIFSFNSLEEELLSVY